LHFRYRSYPSVIPACGCHAGNPGSGFRSEPDASEGKFPPIQTTRLRQLIWFRHAGFLFSLLACVVFGLVSGVSNSPYRLHQAKSIGDSRGSNSSHNPRARRLDDLIEEPRLVAHGIKWNAVVNTTGDGQGNQLWLAGAVEGKRAGDLIRRYIQYVKVASRFLWEQQISREGYKLIWGLSHRIASQVLLSARFAQTDGVSRKQYYPILNVSREGVANILNFDGYGQIAAASLREGQRVNDAERCFDPRTFGIEQLLLSKVCLPSDLSERLSHRMELTIRDIYVGARCSEQESIEEQSDDGDPLFPRTILHWCLWGISLGMDLVGMYLITCCWERSRWYWLPIGLFLLVIGFAVQWKTMSFSETSASFASAVVVSL
jgi:hypothetical protein